MPVIDSIELGSLLDSHGAALEFFARQWSTLPEDCVQEAFVQLARQIPPPNNKVAWLYRVTRNTAINQARSEKRRKHYEQNKAMMLQRDQALGDDELDDIHLAVEQLDDEHRELITLRIWAKLTWDEIAVVLSTSSSTAQRKYAAAIDQLKQLWSHHV